MHPLDGREWNIADGETVQVISQDGELRAVVKLTDAVKPGVVCLRQGTWIYRNSEGHETGASANLVTSTVPTMPSFGSRTHQVWVKIEKPPDKKPHIYKETD
jgi:anaerobic selenocysteine-containing dehydrogenase